MHFDLKKLTTYPSSCGVYLMKDAKNLILYIGKAKNLRQRIRQYFAKSPDSRDMIPFLTSKISSVEFIITQDEKDALLLENTLIKKHQPKYNALLKDDKTYISLMINTSHKWPMIRLVRYKGAPKKDGRYFGPYTNTFSARQTLKTLQKVFPLRQCSDKELVSRKRPCILFEMQRCLAPCVHHCSKEHYDSFVKRAEKFLKGEDKELIAKLKQEMLSASENLEFEKANEILHTLKQLEHIHSHGKSLTHPNVESLDSLYLCRHKDFSLILKLKFRMSKLIGSDHFTFKKSFQTTAEILESFILQHYEKTEDIPKTIVLQEKLASHKILEEILLEKTQKKIGLEHPLKGEKRKILHLTEENAIAALKLEEKHASAKEELLMQLQETLKLTACPLTIECFDTSSHSGRDMVAASVRYYEGKPDKKMYRKYTIKDTKITDDYGALREALHRHFSKLTQNTMPDLVMVDGGRGQLNILKNIFQELGIANVDLISIAKEKSLHTKGLTKEKIYTLTQKEPILLTQHSPLLFFLQSIRDEAHRCAISFYRKKEKKKLTQSELDNIEGIGPIKKKRLLHYFKSVASIKNASIKELEKIDGLTKKDKDILAKKLGMKS